jgi:hypothetical protein
MRVLAPLVLLCFACATTEVAEQGERPPAIPKAKWVEEKPLGEDAAKTKLPLPKGADATERVEAIEEGAAAPFAGVVVNEARALRDAQFRIAYPGMRERYEADRGVFSAHRLFYETQLAQAEDEVSKLQPSWWDEHKGDLAFVGGFILGAALTAGAAVTMFELGVLAAP